MGEVKRMTVKEFRDRGYLQELNRLFLHPLGLALGVVVQGGHESFGTVWDYRDDPEGIVFDILGKRERVKAETIAAERAEKAGVRAARLGYVVQPFDYDFPKWFWELDTEARGRILAEVAEGEKDLNDVRPSG
jgi:hypothetical protein